jgi:hypothetical protein
MRVTTGIMKLAVILPFLAAAFLGSHLPRIAVYGGELGDGVIQFTDVRADALSWEREAGFDAFNLYRGDLATLRDYWFAYTQDPAWGPAGGRFCGLTEARAGDAHLPAPGKVTYYLVAGVAGGIEGTLGADSQGRERVNAYSCGAAAGDEIRTVVYTDGGAYAPGQKVRIAVVIYAAADYGAIYYFNTTCQAYITVEDSAGNTLFDWSRWVACGAALTELRLEPGQARAYSFDWSQVDDYGMPVGAPGAYTAHARWHDNQPAPEGEKGVSVLSGPRLFTAARLNGHAFAAGDAVGVRVAVGNYGDAPATLQFPTACQAAFSISKTLSGESLYDVDLHRACAPSFTELTVPPGESREFPFSWDQRDDGGALLLAGLYWAHGRFDAPDVPRGRNWIYITGRELPVRTSVRTDREAYAAGETVTIFVGVSNISAAPVTLRFSDCQAHFVVESDAGEILYSNGSYADRENNDTCGLAGSITLGPGGSREFAFLWDQRDSRGVPARAPATYHARGIIDSRDAPADAMKPIPISPAAAP